MQSSANNLFAVSPVMYKRGLLSSCVWRLTGGLTTQQQAVISTATLYLTFHLDYIQQFSGNLAAIKDWTKLEPVLRGGGNGIAGIGESYPQCPVGNRMHAD